MSFYKCIIDYDKCKGCGFCTWYIDCPGRDECVDCQVCLLGCPNEAIIRIEDDRPRRYVKIYVNGEGYEVPERITLKRAFQIIGFTFSKIPSDRDIYTPCETGGCYACAVLVDGVPRQLCTTPIRNGMKIELNADFEPLRIVSGFTPHPVGGVGTPWYLKKRGRYIEVACFAHGCNFRCPQCQNWTITYGNNLNPLTPKEAAEELTALRRLYGVDRMAISGGEPTLNRRWLIKFFKWLKRLNKDEKARLHLDTNTSLLTKDYIDELIESGVTDIGADLKAFKIETFMTVTGVKNKSLAEYYLKNAWNAIKYIIDEYKEKVFLGVGIPYNPAWMTDDELFSIGRKLVDIDSEIQVCLLDYRPEFRRRNIKWPSYFEMKKARKLLEDTGLKLVIAQTRFGHIGP